jgi:hypothetical protein
MLTTSFGPEVVEEKTSENVERLAPVRETTRVPRQAADNTIGSKVVAYSRVWAVVSLVCLSARDKSQHPKVSQMLS